MKTEFKVNDTVRITGKKGNHHFKIGETGVIIEKNTDWGWKVKNEEDWWWVFDFDMELIQLNSTLIPNDLIISAYKEACVKWKGIIEKACPLLFPKDKFEKGKWYIHNDKDAIFCSNGNQIKSVGFGVEGSGKWTEDFWTYNYYQVKDYRLATPSEVESHLIKVAEEKGFKVGVKFQSAYYGRERMWKSGKLEYDMAEDSLYANQNCIYYNGKWATIIPSELTLEERVAKLEKMIKQ